MSLSTAYIHAKGTRVGFSHDGRYIFSVGEEGLLAKSSVTNKAIEPWKRDFESGIINVALAISNTNQFAVAIEDEVILFSNEEPSETSNEITSVRPSGDLGKIFRSTLKVREMEFSPDGNWLAICSLDTTVSLVNIERILEGEPQIIKLEGHEDTVSSVSYHPTGLLVSTSCDNGSVYFWSISTPNPSVIHTIKGCYAKSSEDNAKSGHQVSWHPEGHVFAIPCDDKVSIYSRQDWTSLDEIPAPNDNIRNSAICVLWSPNGRYLAIGYEDGTVIIYEMEGTDKRSLIAKEQIRGLPVSMSWLPRGPELNMLAVSSQDGPIFLWTLEFETKTNRVRYDAGIQDSRNGPETNGFAGNDFSDTDEINVNGHMMPDEDDDFVDDDDGAGYAEPDERSKRLFEDDYNVTGTKKFRQSYETFHPQGAFGPLEMAARPFQHGSTPWNGDRRYLFINEVGYVFTVRQDDGDHNSVTVVFHDTSKREYYFTDYDKFQMASLTDEACVFASHGSKTTPARLMLRFHTSMTKDNWEMELTSGDGNNNLENDRIVSVSLSKKILVVVTGSGLVRTFTIYGTPISVYKEGQNRLLTVASYNGYFMTARTAADGSINYNLTDVLNRTVIQKNCPIELSYGKEHLKSLFFSEEGDPYIFSSEGLLYVLSRWRTPLQATWIPVFDCSHQQKANEITCWPLGVFKNMFRCYLLKGFGNKYPSMPLPVHQELELSVPCVKADEGEMEKLESVYLTNSTLKQLVDERLSEFEGSEEEREEIEQDRSKYNIAAGKALLKQLGQAIKEAKIGKGIGIIGLLEDRIFLEPAAKLATAYDQPDLIEAAQNRLREIEAHS